MDASGALFDFAFCFLLILFPYSFPALLVFAILV